MNKFNYREFTEDGDILHFPGAVKKPKEDTILEAAGDALNLADAQMRSMAMSAVLAWLEDKDYSYNSLDEYMIGIADLDGDEELTEDENAVYEDLWSHASDAMLSLGADAGNVGEFLDGEDDGAGAKLGKFLSGIMDNMPSSDDEIVSGFATGADGQVFECADVDKIEADILEAAYKKTKVIRGGKVVIKKKRISGKVRLSAAQKAGLKKARRKAHTSAAKMHRKKSKRKRKSRGM